MDNNEEKIEHIPGCPLCEHSDPELEKEVEEFARWLYEVMLHDQEEAKKKGDSEKK